jgi:STE24 endopeptidase
MRLGLKTIAAAMAFLLLNPPFRRGRRRAGHARGGADIDRRRPFRFRLTGPTAMQQFDPVKATNAYLAQVNGAARAIRFLFRRRLLSDPRRHALCRRGVGASAVAAHLGGMRNIAQGVTRSKFWQVPIYVMMYVALVAVLTFPLTVYEDFFREHAYGLSNQNFAQWLRDFAVGFLVQLVAAIVLTVIYAVIRATPRMWWIWGTLVTVIFLAIGLMVGPVFIAPLFNTYTSLKDGPSSRKSLTLARGNGIPATDVYEFDASKQSKRISANVSGLFGTTRISLNDNLINRCTPTEIDRRSRSTRWGITC